MDVTAKWKHELASSPLFCSFMDDPPSSIIHLVFIRLACWMTDRLIFSLFSLGSINGA